MQQRLRVVTGLLGLTAMSALLMIESRLNDLKKELDELKKSRLEVADRD